MCVLLCLCAGKISEPEVVTQFIALLAAGVGTAYALDSWVGHEFPTLTVLAVFGSIISYIYSAPPLKLKQSGWIGNYALGSSYIALPWWAGQVRHTSRHSSQPQPQPSSSSSKTPSVPPSSCMTSAYLQQVTGLGLRGGL